MSTHRLRARVLPAALLSFFSAATAPTQKAHPEYFADLALLK